MYRRTAARAAALACAVTTLLVVAPGPAEAAKAKPKVRVANKPAQIEAGTRISLTGSVRGALPKGRLTAELQQQTAGTRFKKVASARLKPRKRFALRWTAPASAGTPRLRVQIKKRRKLLARSAAFRVTVIAKPVATPPSPAPAPARTQVIDPTRVTKLPAPGEPGELRLSGDVDVKPGDVLSGGVGPNSPDGFLLKAQTVTKAGGETIVSVVPATLLEAVQEGEFNQQLETAELDTLQPAPSVKASRRPGSDRVDVRAAFDCTAGAKVTVDGSVKVKVGIDAGAKWGFLSLKSARVIGNATASARLNASASGSVSCTAGPFTLFEARLSPITFTVGPIPVVLRPVVTVYISAKGTVEAKVSTEVHGSLTAQAGVRYENGGFSGVGSFSKEFGWTPPAPEGNASLEGTVSPTLDVLLYGVGGPRAQVNIGLRIETSTGDPQWRLLLPVSLTARLIAPVLSLKSPEFTVFKNDFVLAQADPRPAPTTIDFEDLADGTTVTNQYAGKGLVIDTNASAFSNFLGTEGDRVLHGDEPFHRIAGHIVDPASGQAGTVSSLTLDVEGLTGIGTVKLVATLADGTTREDVNDRSDPVPNPVGGGTAFGEDRLSVTAAGIKSFELIPTGDDEAFLVDNVVLTR